MKHQCSKLTSKGQITIPVYIREKLHLSAGSKLEFIIYNNSFLVIPINKSVKNLQNILPKPNKSLSLEEMDDIIGPRVGNVRKWQSDVFIFVLVEI